MSTQAALAVHADSKSARTNGTTKKDEQAERAIIARKARLEKLHQQLKDAEAAEVTRNEKLVVSMRGDLEKALQQRDKVQARITRLTADIAFLVPAEVESPADAELIDIAETVDAAEYLE